jgi:sec-independent protein translocase protein TatA
MGAIQPWHWLVLIVVVVMLFGYKRLPDAARSVGRSMRIFKSEVGSLRDDDQQARDTGTARQTPSSPPIIEGEPVIRPTTASDEASRRRTE